MGYIYSLDYWGNQPATGLGQIFRFAIFDKLRDLIDNNCRACFALLSAHSIQSSSIFGAPKELGPREHGNLRHLSKGLQLLPRRFILTFVGPAIHAFRTVLGSDENVARVMKQLYKVKFCDAANYLIPNVELLQSYCGISGDKLQKRIIHSPKTYCVKKTSFKNFLIRVEENLGIPRNSGMFVYGIECVAVCSDKNIYDNCQVFKSFGWTQSDVMELIGRNPLCLTLNEESIKNRLDFLIHQLGFKPDQLASMSSFFTYSIGKRLLPRHRVLLVLKEKGLIKEHHLLSSASVLTEANFLKKFILPFEEIHEVYAQLTGSTVESLVAGRAKGQI